VKFAARFKLDHFFSDRETDNGKVKRTDLTEVLREMQRRCPAAMRHACFS